MILHVELNVVLFRGNTYWFGSDCSFRFTEALISLQHFSVGFLKNVYLMTNFFDE